MQKKVRGNLVAVPISTDCIRKPVPLSFQCGEFNELDLNIAILSCYSYYPFCMSPRNRKY